MKKQDVLKFDTKCMKVTLDYSRCEAARKRTSEPGCGFACVKADRMYDRNILRIEGNRPVLTMPASEVKKVSNESLSWEYACDMTGNHAIEIEIPFPGLAEYRKKMQL